MFKFLKDFLFEENEVAVAAPPATGSVTSLDERLDMGAGTEQPAGSDGAADTPFWNPTPAAATPTPAADPAAAKPATPASPLMLDIQGGKDDTDTSEPLAGDTINLDSLDEPDVNSTPEPAPAPAPEKKIEVKKEETPTPPPVVAKEEPKEEPPVMDITAQEPPPMPATPAAAPVQAKPMVPDIKVVDQEQEDLARIEVLLKKTAEETEAEKKAIADLEAQAKMIEDKLNARRARMMSLEQAPNDLQKAKAELEILLKNKKEVENKITDISSQLTDSGKVTNSAPTNLPQ